MLKFSSSHVIVNLVVLASLIALSTQASQFDGLSSFYNNLRGNAGNALNGGISDLMNKFRGNGAGSFNLNNMANTFGNPGQMHEDFNNFMSDLDNDKMNDICQKERDLKQMLGSMNGANDIEAMLNDMKRMTYNQMEKCWDNNVNQESKNALQSVAPELYSQMTKDMDPLSMTACSMMQDMKAMFDSVNGDQQKLSALKPVLEQMKGCMKTSMKPVMMDYAMKNMGKLMSLYSLNQGTINGVLQTMGIKNPMELVSQFTGK